MLQKKGKNYKKRGFVKPELNISYQVQSDFAASKDWRNNLSDYLVSTIDYNGKPMKFYGKIEYTIGEFIKILENKPADRDWETNI